MSNSRLLLVHPNSSALALLRSMLFTLGGRIEEATSDREAVRMLERGGTDVILAGVEPADPDALELLLYARRKHPQTPVILLFSTPHPDRSREAMQRGASAVLRFPLPATELRAAVAQALERPDGAFVPVKEPAHTNGNGYTNGSHGKPNGTHTVAGNTAVGEQDLLIGQDPALRLAIELAMAIAPTRTPVLIQGESGTGKTLLARAIHQHSARADAPFVKVCCGNLKAPQLERELFGPAGAAVGSKMGKIAQAQGGTLVLHDIAALGPDLQAKMLRLIQEMEGEVNGHGVRNRLDVRLIFTATEDLAGLVAQGRVRPELYQRISSVCLKLPPLRQRGSDIEALAQFFRSRFANDLNRDVLGFAPEALEALRQHPWPGNVRELESMIERGIVFCRGPRITPANLALGEGDSRLPRPRVLSPRPSLGMGIRPLKEALEEPEKQLILQALEALNWNRQETARILDINRTTLYKKMKKYGLLDFEPACSN